MIDETEIFDRFHSAFVAEPRPGAAQLLRRALIDQAAQPTKTAAIRVRISLRLIAAVALVAVAMATTGVFFALHRASYPAPIQAPGSHTLSRTTWGMVSPTVGWHLGSASDIDGVPHIFRTSDAGSHWKDVTPSEGVLGITRPSALGDFANAVYILDANHVWLTETFGPGLPSRISFLVTVSTSDGGRTWHQSSVVVKAGSDRYPGLTNLSVYFLDPTHGWLLVQAYWSNDAVAPGDRLYRTLDGGMNWSLVGLIASTDEASCHGQQPVFASAADGWISLACYPRNAGLQVTHDGGATWATQSLPAGMEVDCCNGPYVLDMNYVVLFATSPEGNYVLVTMDRGTTWTARALPGGDAIPVSFLDGEHWWATSATGLYRTDDAGLSWKLVGTLDSVPNSVSDLYFVDLVHGFADDGDRYFRTSDGGKSWSVVDHLPGQYP